MIQLMNQLLVYFIPKKMVIRQDSQLMQRRIMILDFIHTAPNDRYAGIRALLSGFVMMRRPKVVAEVGCKAGRTTACMIAAARVFNHDTHFYAVDIANRGIKKTMDEAFKKWPGNLMFIRKKGQDIKEEDIQTPVDILFVDAEHTFETTTAILERWMPWMAPKGVIVMDDVQYFQVKQAWWRVKHPKVVIECGIGGIGIIEIG